MNKFIFTLTAINLCCLCNITAQTGHRLVLPIGHTSNLTHAQFSPDGKLIVTASEDNTAKIWEVKSGKLLADLTGHTSWVNSAQFSPDGLLIATASSDNTIIIWDVETGGLIHSFNEHLAGVNSVFFSHDGKYVLSASDDGTAKMWNVNSRVLIFDLRKHESRLKKAIFSPDGKHILTIGSSGEFFIWNTSTGNLLNKFEGYHYYINSINFSPDGTRIIAAKDSLAIIYNIKKGVETYRLIGHKSNITSAFYSSDGERILTASTDCSFIIWDSKSFKPLQTIEHSCFVLFASYSPDGKHIISICSDIAKDDFRKFIQIWDVGQNKSICKFEVKDLYISGCVCTVAYSMNGNYFSLYPVFGPASIWNIQNGRLVNTLIGETCSVAVKHSPFNKLVLNSCETTLIWDNESNQWTYSKFINATYSPNGNTVATIHNDSIIKIWDQITGEQISVLACKRSIRSITFNLDGTCIIVEASEKLQVWDVIDGILLQEKESFRIPISPASFNHNSRLILSNTLKGGCVLWDKMTGDTLNKYPNDKRTQLALLNPNCEFVLTASSNNVKIWETISGRPVHNLVGHKWSVIKAAFSPSGEKIITGDVKGVLKVWNGQTGNYLYDLSGHKSWIQSIQFSADEDKVLTSSIEGKVKMWNSKTGNLIFDFCGHTNEVLSANFSFNEHFIITTGSDNKIILWDATTGKMLYTRLQLTNNDWLVYDEHYRYDGSAGARDYLYFVCGLEIIDLAQLKDALYVPGLVEKIMSGQEINYPKLSGLEICDALPLIEQIEHSEHTFHYKITPRKLPLEYVEVYVNDKKIRNVFTHELNRKEDSFYLILDDDEIKRHFIHGGENKVKVVGIVRQKGSELRSRGAEYVEIDKSPPLIPRLYALMIGVSDYKDDRLDLVYPSKDASDLGKAVEMSAKKMLGDDNVFIYMVHSDVTVNNGFSTPEKEGIRRALQDIGSKARPVDVVLVFFAGHGTMQGTKDNMFTFLTSETSEINQVGISIKELQSWLSYDGPHRMLANKTILIFDACHSGQAIKELTAMIRTDDDTRRIRQVEDLKDKSGVFILAAAASDQQAYEMGLYEQGLLTYSLLHTMKYNPEVLEEWRFLNVQKWFLESEKFLQDLVRSRNLHQQAQPFGTANIRIGEVDDEVKNSIRLAEEKPVVVCANIFNDATSNDDLRLKILISDKLMEISKRGVDKSIAYASYETESANRINIRYTINADNVACDVRLYKQGELLHNTIIKGTTNNLEALAAKIIEEIVGHAK